MDGYVCVQCRRIWGRGLSEGSGIIIFDNGRIFGGDALYYYVGTYEDVVDNHF
ncbi:MAG: hypothetical protein ACERKJ_03785 [Candidatus Dadabacteria bacterium]